jgi:hypothetical protein
VGITTISFVSLRVFTILYRTYTVITIRFGKIFLLFAVRAAVVATIIRSINLVAIALFKLADTLRTVMQISNLGE